MGKTAKSSPNSESTVEKFVLVVVCCIAASLTVSPFSLSSSICHTNFLCIVKPRRGVGGGGGGGKTLSGSDSYIFRLSLLAGS